MTKKVSTESYKGVRDFYPKDQFIQRFLFETMSRVAEAFGYEEYGASLLEPSELYENKTSEEIVSEQTYMFTDRGERKVTLRPEMTPTVARLVAAKRREFAFPLRLYSIPNVFRYERPQRGRLREHWQLNADIFGVSEVEAEAEIIALAHRIMTEFGARESDFEIRINDRALLSSIYEKLEITGEKARKATRLLDKREKDKNFKKELVEAVGKDAADKLEQALEETSSTAYFEQLIGILRNAYSIRNAAVDTSIVRGFDYYTGMVFEVYDTSQENKRSLFGGGRYDNLMEIFGSEPIPAVGFGMGDVTARDFLETHGLLPSYAPATELMLCPLSRDTLLETLKLAQALRSADVTVAINYSGRRVRDMIAQADKMGIPFIICIGEKEIDTGKYTIKHLESGKETTLSADRIADHLFSSAG